MHKRLLTSIAVAAVFLSASPAYAQWTQPIYEYWYFDNGQIVGKALDDCSESGVTTNLLWGYSTSDVHVGHLADCVNGWWTPL